MNGSRTSNAVLLSEIVAGLTASGAASAVCVPAPYLAQCQAQLAGSALGWGAQDVSAHASGAYTGEISAAMLQDFGCGYVVIGHSERRAYHGESDAQVAAKTVAALAAVDAIAFGRGPGAFTGVRIAINSFAFSGFMLPPYRICTPAAATAFFAASWARNT